MIIFIEVEIAGRELLSKILLSRALINKNNLVIISNRNNIHNLINKNKIKNSILITKDINPRHDLIKFYKYLKSNGFVIISQDEEGGYLPNDYSIFTSMRHGKGEVLYIIDYFLCWGKRDYNFLKRKFKSISYKFINFGSPKLDAMKKNYKVNKNLLIKNKIKKKFILLSYNFTPFYYKPLTKGILDESTRLNKDFRKFAKKMFYSYGESAKLLYDFTELADYLEKNQNKYQVVIRPHPNFNSEIFRKIVKNYNKNIIICSEGNLIEYIKNCSVLIQNSCSSAVDAVISKKQVISYKTKNKEFMHSPYINSLGIKCESNLEVLKIINSNKIKNKFNILNKRFNLENSLIKINNLIKNLQIENDKNKINVKFNRLSFKFVFKKIIFKFFPKKEGADYADHKYKDFNYKNIKRIVAQVNASKFNGLKNKIKFKIKSKNILVINKL